MTRELVAGHLIALYRNLNGDPASGHEFLAFLEAARECLARYPSPTASRLLALYRDWGMRKYSFDINADSACLAATEELEARYELDPSDFNVALLLATQYLENNRISRAKQLLSRIAASEYEQKERARLLLETICSSERSD